MFKKLLSAGSTGEVLAVILLFAFGTASAIQGEINGRGSIYRNPPGTGLINQAPTEKKDLSIKNHFLLAKYSSYQKLVNPNIFDSNFLLASDSIKPTPTEDVYAFKNKSLKRGFVYSLILPGAGEFYADSKIKAGIFLGLEALFWTGYFTYHSKGVDKRNEYKAYANANWSDSTYWENLLAVYGDTVLKAKAGDKLIGTTPDGKKDSVVITHGLPTSRTQQYYEMIGKYDQFRYGWEDYDIEAMIANTAYRSTYLDIRNESNRFLDRSKLAIMASLANRILSAFDAAISVKRYNRKGEGFSSIQMKVRMVEYKDELIPAVSLNMRF
jgi:hypothetical protein